MSVKAKMKNVLNRDYLIDYKFLPDTCPENLADLPLEKAVKLFIRINPGSVKIFDPYGSGFTKTWIPSAILVSKVNPNGLWYPEGWHYAKGYFRNKHGSTTGIYQEVPILTIEGQSWEPLRPRKDDL